MGIVYHVKNEIEKLWRFENKFTTSFHFAKIGDWKKFTVTSPTSHHENCLSINDNKSRQYLKDFEMNKYPQSISSSSSSA